MDRRVVAKSSLGIIAGHNIAQNTVLNRRGYVAANLLVASTLASLGKASGLGFGDMGLSPKLSRRDLRLSGMVAALTAGGSLAALIHPRTRRLLEDERAQDISGEVIAYKCLIRFPLGTALFEEAVFRGVLPAVIGPSETVGDLTSAGAFGLWHLIPTALALPGNPLSDEMTLTDQAKTVMAGCAATTLAGFGFSWLRRRSGSIVLPWLVHTAFNTITYLASVLAWRVGKRPS